MTPIFRSKRQKVYIFEKDQGSQLYLVQKYIHTFSNSLKKLEGFFKILVEQLKTKIFRQPEKLTLILLS